MPGMSVSAIRLVVVRMEAGRIKFNATPMHHQRGNRMTIQGFVVSHAKDAEFERGLRSFFEYRDLGIKTATRGQVDAHVIRAASGKDFSSQPHLHKTAFQLVYVLKGWIEFEYEGQGVVRLEAGSCVHQPPGIRHRELGHSEDIEMLEVVLPAGFATEEVAAVND
jgi:quercetin dioxygenase-like cupin family protein